MPDQDEECVKHWEKTLKVASSQLANNDPKWPEIPKITAINEKKLRMIGNQEIS